MLCRFLFPASLLVFACTGEPGSPAPDGATQDSGAPMVDDTGWLSEGSPILLLPTLGLDASQLAIVVNTDDPLSADIARAYAEARGIDESRIHAFALGTEGVLDEDDFHGVFASLQADLAPEVQALLLTFTTPYRVSCMGAAAAFGLGFDEVFCSETTCSNTQPSDYFDSESVLPFDDHGVRPTVMLSADTLPEAEEIIARGLAADDTNPPGDGWFIRTTDSARSVRYSDFARTAQSFEPDSLTLTYVDNSDGSGSNLLTDTDDVMFYLTGLTSVDDIDTNSFRPGALADHLTSYGGVLSDSNSQMPITAWLEGGATASYGTAVEPCNYTQKFPEAEVLVSRYFRGATAVEAYWKSVHWPGEGNFVGDPLARPWSPSWSWEDGVLTVSTTHMDTRSDWAIEGADSADGPWEVVDSKSLGADWARVEFEVLDAWQGHYRLVELAD